ncbi:MAG: hypothetical protein NTW54_07075 [Bacteroidetes bacterium]|nr:hypothetical protein [Bacteroidota bacterium]
MNPTVKKFIPHAIALVCFIVVSFFYFNEVASGSKQIKQHDSKMYEGAAAESAQYNKDEVVFFTESMFSGMPMYLINMPYYGNIVYNKLASLYNLYLPYPVNQLFVLMLGFYILLLTFKVNPYMAIGGALAFALSSNNMVFTAAGHVTKVSAIGYIPLVLAGFNMVLHGNKWLGASLTAIGLSFQMGANHFQITYYMFFIIGAWYIAEFVGAAMKKNYKDILIRSVFLGVALGLGAATGLSSVMVSKEYGEYSIRGKSELTINKTADEQSETGLDRNYTFEYSYSGLEPLTMLIPNLYGGAEQAPFDKTSQTYKLAASNQNAKELTSYLMGYWGDLRITAGPPYFGALVFFLFVLGCIMVRSPIKWALLGATVLSIALAYGRNFESFNYFMFDYFPYYNKFRAVTTAFVIAQVCVPILAFLGLKEFFDALKRKENVLKKFYYAAGISAGLCLVFVLAPGTTISFTTYSEDEQKDVLKSKYAQVFGKNIPAEYEEAITADCKDIVKTEALRSLLFILIGAGALFAFMKNKVKMELVLGILAFAIVVDMFMIDKRYLGPDQLEKKRKNISASFPKSKADEIILANNSDNGRVLNLAVSPFNDASTSYYHRSIGGYHGAKVKRYQELIEYHIQPEIQILSKELQSSKGADSTLKYIFRSTPILNMLDAKYIIYNTEAAPIENNNNLGHCWFVKNYEVVANADSEILALNRINTGTTCVIDQRFSSQVNNMSITDDTSASIKQTEYHPNHQKYESNSATPQIAVFSEIYYEPDWELFIDGSKVNYFRCNYVLRGAVIPAGKHTLEFKINAKTYNTWEGISKASSYLIFALLIGSLVLYFRNKKNNIA